MTHAYTIVEPTAALRDWLRTVPALSAYTVWAGGLPKNADLPAIAIMRQGGPIDGVLDNGLYRFNIWAITASEAATASSVLISTLMSTGPTHMGDGIWFMGSTPTSPAYLPDPDNEALQRYTVAAQVTTRFNP